MPRMTIGRFAKEAGIGVETVRYYHRRRLLPLPGAGATRYREYGPDLLRRVRFIRQAQAAGFTLEEVRELLRLDGSTDRERVRALAGARRDEIERRIRELRSVSTALARVLHDCEHGPAGARCPIIAAFDGAA